MVIPQPTIAVSRCLLGEAVRYDGRSKPAPELIAAISSCCKIIPVCPEVEAGLSTPRPPVQLVQLDNRAIVVRGRDNHTIEITTLLAQQATHFIRQYPVVDAALLQNRSPSCGVGDTPLFTPDGEEIAVEDGHFTSVLRTAYPGIFITSPRELRTSTQIETLLSQLKTNTKSRTY